MQSTAGLAGEEMPTPVTEAANPITENIDVASPLDIVSLLHKCDQEIFEGWNEYKSLYDADVLATLDKLITVAASVIKNPSTGAVVLSGCGTSGRIGFITTRTFNAKLSELSRLPCFKYLIAGRDKALFTSQEAPEDDPQCGVEMLKEATAGKKQVLFIGITCGLSAPFVGGQLQYCLDNLDVFTPVVLGFNPTHLARNNPIEKWDSTFLQVVNKMEEMKASSKVFILNPVVGPEPITGSSRMKSGSATKILLETIFAGATLSVLPVERPWQTEPFLRCYQAVCDHIYTKENIRNIAQIVELAGNSLRSNGSIYYVGEDTLGIMGMIDASECPPTYGSSLSDVRGFLDQGYKAFRNNDGDLSLLGKHFQISFNDMKKDILPFVKPSDLVIYLSQDGKIDETVTKCHCKKALISFASNSPTRDMMDVEVGISLPKDKLVSLIGEEAVDHFLMLFEEISLKWICNAITTGAHVLKGKVFQNIMVDLKVSNNKLFHRAIGIIQRFSGLSTEQSRDYLLQSIYNTDSLTENVRSYNISSHIETATPLSQVVPRALLSAILHCSVSESHKLLEKEPVIQRVISQTLSGLQNNK
ncbi:glucokinase regulatory protein-like [Saccostrea echinata]|uniref:glucokinase regulatory protein-like n=1 Tax=Saccostrea echinata TaxID=191078 RepID=UPI002A82B793|nr:glucokinase regulatory protein-like [Saccostrea echinata]